MYSFPRFRTRIPAEAPPPLLARVPENLGFADARVKAVAPMRGVRETRRIVGCTVMGVSDVLDRRAFPDVIGFSAYGWDLPDPRKPSCQPMRSGDRLPSG